MRRFQPVPWSQRTNLYEVNIRQYTKEGNFAAFEKELPRLSAMGVETLWLMPIFPISIEKRQGTLGSYYAISDYKAINPEFGTVSDFKSFLRTAWSYDFKIILDWVANHTGYDHIWTKSTPGFYKKNDKDEFYDNNGWKDVIDLNYYDAAMRREMINAMRYWVEEFNIDGFRCDMAHLVPRDFWRDARVELDAIKPLYWLAESNDWNYLEVFDTCYSWDWMHLTEAFCSEKKSLKDLKNHLQHLLKNFPAGASQLFFTTNHDENSWNGTEYEKYGENALNLAVFSATWNGIPLIYSGQELPNLQRLKFFDKDEIRWTGKYELEEFYRLLLLLKKNNPALVSGKELSLTRLIDSEDKDILAYERINQHDAVIVILNMSAQEAVCNFDASLPGSYLDLFSKETYKIEKTFSISTPGNSHHVLVKIK